MIDIEAQIVTMYPYGLDDLDSMLHFIETSSVPHVIKYKESDMGRLFLGPITTAIYLAYNSESAAETLEGEIAEFTQSALVNRYEGLNYERVLYILIDVSKIGEKSDIVHFLGLHSLLNSRVKLNSESRVFIS
jgi:hypothetical protein